jgi:hypothetical protein
MSTAELKNIVDHASLAEKRFLFVYLAETLNPNTTEQMDKWDRRMADMHAGKNRVSAEEFEKRLDRRPSK